MPPKIDELVYIQPGVGVTVEVANAQFRFISNMAPYLNQAAGLDQKDEFMREVFRVFFDRWPDVPKPNEDAGTAERRKALTRKRIRSDLGWRRSAKGIAEGTWKHHLHEEEQKTFALQLEELLGGDGPIVMTPEIKRGRHEEYSPPRYDRRLLPRPKKRARRVIGFIDLTNDSDSEEYHMLSATFASSSGQTLAEDNDGVSASGVGALGDSSDVGDDVSQMEGLAVDENSNISM